MPSFVSPFLYHRARSGHSGHRPAAASAARLAAASCLILVSACGAMAGGHGAPPLQIEQLEGAAPPATHGAASAASAPNWLAALQDGAIDQLVSAALLDNPTLGQALARIDAARAQADLSAAATRPALSVDASSGRGQAQTGTGSNTETGRSSTIGASAQWELDLFGRLKAARRVAGQHLAARSADAQAMRFSLSAQVAASVIDWRVCTLDLRGKEALAASLARMRTLSQQRVAGGLDATAEFDNTQAALLAAANGVSAQAAACERHVHALTTLSGLAPARVRELLGVAPRLGVALQENYRVVPIAPDAAQWTATLRRQGVPLPPVADIVPVLPAQLVARQSAVVAALAEADAAWYGIEQSRADRWPKIDLSANLMRQWLASSTTSLNYTTWMLGPAVSAMLYDGGAAEASISAAEARYRESVAKVHAVVRSSIEDIGNALTQVAGADATYRLAAQSLSVNSRLLDISESKWAAGAENAFQREASWRQFVQAQNSFVAAAGDRVQARIALARATENQYLIEPNHPSEPSSAFHPPVSQ